MCEVSHTKKFVGVFDFLKGSKLALKMFPKCFPKVPSRFPVGFVEGSLTLLLSTGANGAQNHSKFIKSLASLQQSIQVIALCGHNTKAQEELGTLQQIYPQLTIRALGKRSDMYELMQIADLIVARPGTGTTSEAIMVGCPLIMNTLGGVMPQEWITRLHRARQSHEFTTS